jgi:DNA-binding NarL/FixJ family response regulator
MRGMSLDTMASASANTQLARSSIKVGIVEDDTVVLTTMSTLLNESSGFRCVAACASGEEAVEQLPAASPEVVLMDINLPRMSGIECTRRLKARLPGVQVLMLTVYEDSEHIYQALRAGATGYMLKRSEPDEVLAAIRDILKGGAPMNSQIARKVIQTFRASAQSLEPEIRLTKREEEILSCLAEGYSDKELAERLGITVPTVRTHLSHIYEKLHVQSRTEAVIKYLH